MKLQKKKNNPKQQENTIAETWEFKTWAGEACFRFTLWHILHFILLVLNLRSTKISNYWFFFFVHTIILTMEKSGSLGRNDFQMCISCYSLTNQMTDANSRCRPGDIVGRQKGEATGSLLMMVGAFQSWEWNNWLTNASGAHQASLLDGAALNHEHTRLYIQTMQPWTLASKSLRCLCGKIVHLV